MIRFLPRLLVLVGILSSGSAEASCELARSPRLVDVPAEEWLETVPSEVVRRLDQEGFAFPEESAIDECPGMVPALVIFDQPPDRVFGLLIQTERHGEFMKSLRSVDPVSRRPEEHVDRHEMKILFKRIAYHVRHDWSPELGRIWWDLSPAHPNDLRSIMGFWELHPLGANRSLALYGTRVDVGPIIPARLQESLTRKNLRMAVENVRRWVEREGGATR
ncbi:MAG: SRPBCC family protein [Deltaproteobacteria bacterium]|jgi:hypothetical protein|nr:SRPBCC family protein [Deltaproteobacteria bacterium]